MRIAPERNGTVLVAADVDNEVALRCGKTAKIKLHARDVNIGIRIVRRTERDAALCKRLLEIGGAEIGVHEVEVDNGDGLTGLREVEREGGREIGLAGAEMTGDDDDFLRLIHIWHRMCVWINCLMQM